MYFIQWCDREREHEATAEYPNTVFQIYWAIMKTHGITQKEYDNCLEDDFDIPWITVLCDTGEFCDPRTGSVLTPITRDSKRIPLIKYP